MHALIKNIIFVDIIRMRKIIYWLIVLIIVSISIELNSKSDCHFSFSTIFIIIRPLLLDPKPVPQPFHAHIICPYLHYCFVCAVPSYLPCSSPPGYYSFVIWNRWKIHAFCSQKQHWPAPLDVTQSLQTDDCRNTFVGCLWTPLDDVDPSIIYPRSTDTIFYDHTFIPFAKAPYDGALRCPMPMIGKCWDGIQCDGGSRICCGF